jgi:hypothetical protein
MTTLDDGVASPAIQDGSVDELADRVFTAASARSTPWRSTSASASAGTGRSPGRGR